MSIKHTDLIGPRLRRIRQQQRLSLADVQERSGGRWKAVVVGAYERGDRAITVSRLVDLAAFYGVPVSDLLPTPSAPADADDGRVVLDLTRLDESDPPVAAVARFAGHVRRQRGDHNGRVLTLRGGDLETIALATDRSPAELRASLTERAVIRPLDDAVGATA